VTAVCFGGQQPEREAWQIAREVLVIPRPPLIRQWTAVQTPAPNPAHQITVMASGLEALRRCHTRPATSQSRG